MENYTVALFGHRNMRTFPVSEMYDLFQSLLEAHEQVEFLVGIDGWFDSQAATVLSHLMTEHPNCTMTLVLPCQSPEYTKNRAYYEKRFTSVEICKAFAGVPDEDVFSVRSRNMIDRADLIVCGIEHESGSAWDAVQYARSEQKKVINVCLSDTDA